MINVDSIVPPPVNVSISHGDRVIAGSSFILKCIVELSPKVDVSVNVIMRWTGPNGTMFDPQPTMTEMMSTRYTNIAEFNAARDGMYTCQATINPKGPESEFIIGSNIVNRSATITVGKCYINVAISLKGMLASSHSQ